MTRSPLRIGLIGYGGFGPFLHRAWEAVEAVTVAAVADADAGRNPGGLRFYTRWEDLLADAGVDVVAVATPPVSHAEIACAAMQAGKHVLIEKPLATTMADARRILAVQRQTGRVAGVDYMQRFNPVVEALHGWCRSGAFGRLRRVVVENYAQDETLPPDHWFWDPERSGGILVEHAVHFIDVVNGCTPAAVKRVDGLGVRRGPGQMDRMMATVVYEDGLVASHFHAFSRPGFFEHTSMRFVFDLAQVYVEGWIPLAGRVTALADDAAFEALEALPGFTEQARSAVGDLADESRPEGWGSAQEAGSAARRLRSGGEPYEVTWQVEGAFDVGRPKGAVYAEALAAVMADLAAAVHDPAHRLRASLEAGIASLDIALRASSQAAA